MLEKYSQFQILLMAVSYNVVVTPSAIKTLLEVPQTTEATTSTIIILLLPLLLLLPTLTIS